MKHILGVWLGLAVLLSGVVSWQVSAARFEFPDPTGYVNDYANVLTNDSEVEAKVKSLVESDSTEIFVLTIEKLPDTVTIETFIPYLTDEHPKWRAGQEKYDNGIFFTLVTGGSEGQRDVRIDVGYGLEGALPDITAKMILENDVVPKLKAGDLNGGVSMGVDKIIKAVRGEYTGGAGTITDSENAPGVIDLLGGCCFMFFFFVFPVLGSFLGRTKSWWLGGILGLITGVIASIVIALALPSWGVFRFLSFILLPAGLGVAGLLFDLFVSKTYRHSKGGELGRILGHTFSSRSGGWGGFSGGGFGGGFGGGGGGSFGGGGAGSKW